LERGSEFVVTLPGLRSAIAAPETSVQATYIAPTTSRRMAETHRPHICILDIGLPGMNGYQVACAAGRLRSSFDEAG
jgi:DNA-binding NarL/FixJ family response regulator